MGNPKMLCATLLVASSLAIFGQAAPGRDLTSDIAAATDLMNKTYDNAYAFQPHIYGFLNVLFADIVPYVNDIQRRMLALGIDPAKIEEQATLYNTYMSEIRVTTMDLVHKIGPLYLATTSKTSYDLNNNINAPTLRQDVQLLEENHAVYHNDFDVGVAEIDRKITELFEFNWLLIQGTSGPDREAIDADLEFIYVATTSYRDDLLAHMASLDGDVRQAVAATNVVIEQLPSKSTDNVSVL